MLQTPGFDLYAHVILTYFYDQANLDSNHQFFDIFIPRYLLLTNIYKSTRIIGIPTGFIAILLWGIPVTYYLNYKRSKYISIQVLIFSLFSLFIAARYSALGLSVLFLFVCLTAHWRYSYLGMFFHPYSIILYSISFFFDYRNIKKNIKGIIFSLIILLVSSLILYNRIFLSLPLYSDSARYIVSSINDYTIFSRSLLRKSDWIIRIISIYLLNFTFKKFRGFKFTLDSAIFIIIIFTFSIFLYTIVYSKASMLYTFDGEMFPLFKASYLDWFQRSFNGTFENMSDLRALHIF